MRTPAALLGLLMALALPAPALAVVFHVTNLNDQGTGSLRQAIADGVASGDADAIVFDAGGQGVITVHKPALALAHDDNLIGPDLVAGKPLVWLDALNAGVQPGLSLATRSVVRNIAFTGFGGSGLVIEGAVVDVTGTWVGVGLDGKCDGNDIGIEVKGDDSHIGNSRDTGNLIRCNLIGVRGNGTAENTLVRGNTITGNQNGVTFEGSFGRLGAVGDANAANVISGNSGNGVMYIGPGAIHGRVTSNFIGTGTAGFGGPATPNGGGAIVYEGEATTNSASGNVIDSGSRLPIATGDTQANTVSNNDVATTFPFVNDGAAADVADNLSPGVFGTLANGMLPFSIANRAPHSTVDVFARRGRCSGKRFVLRSLTSDSAITDDHARIASIETDDAGTISQVLTLPTPNKLAAGDLLVGTTDDQLGTPDLRNPCPLPVASSDPGTPAPPPPPASAPPPDTTAPSTTPVPALGPVGTVSIPIPIPVLNLASPLSKGFRIVAGVTGLSVVIVNPNAFPAAYDVEIRMATFVLKAARFTLAPGKSKTVRLKFSRAAKRFIARKRPRRARVTVKVTGRVASGASKAFTTVRTVTLKRPKRKKH